MKKKTLFIVVCLIISFSIFATDVNPSFLKNVEKLMGTGRAADQAIYEAA